MITTKHSISVLAAVLLTVASVWAADVPVFNGDFETLTNAGKPAGWVNMGVADGFGSTTWPADSDHRVGFLADGQLIYLDIEASQLQLGHRLTVAFDAVKDPQSGPATLLVQLVYRNAEGVLNYAGKQADCEREFEIFGGNSFTRYSMSINIDDEAMVGYPLRVRFSATVQNTGKMIYLDNVTLDDKRLLIGDLNYDGVVDWADLEILLAHWGLSNWVPTVLRPDVGPMPQDLLPERP